MSDELESSSSRRGPGRPAIPTSTAFKPRAGIQRKTKAERDKILQQEQERQQSRTTEGAKERVVGGSSTRGAKSGRGRGQAVVSRDDRIRGDGTGGGVFGAGNGAKTAPKQRATTSTTGDGYSEMLEGQESLQPVSSVPAAPVSPGATASVARGGKGSKSGGGKSGPTKAEEVLGISSDEEPEEPKRDIERIWISSDEEDQDIISRKGKQKVPIRTQRGGVGLRPLRAPRSVVEESEETVRSRFKINKPLKKATTNEIHDVDVDDMEMDDSETVKEPPSSPELKRKPLKKATGKGRDTKSAAETVEERAERLRLNEDVQKLRREFVKPATTNISAPFDQQSDMDDDEAIGHDGKLFLFQFPPFTPFLIDPAAATNHVEVKQESSIEAPPPPANAASSASTSATASAVKKEADASTKVSLQQDGLLTASEPQRLPPGLVGKLRMHKSGKVSLDWGGTDMEVRYGTEVDFLQDVVVVETAPPGETGTAYALGQVRQKMIVIPDWAKLYD